MDARLIALVPLLPLLAAALIAARVLAGRDKGDAVEPATARLALLAMLAALGLLVVFDGLALAHGVPGQVTVAEWFSSGTIKLHLSFAADGLSLPIASLVAFIGLTSLLFSRNYLHREAGFHRFFMAMSLFLAGMLLIVLAGNAVLAFVGWELAGVSSWMLIGYAYERLTATANAQRAFITNRIGDAGFLLGIGLAYLWIGSVEWPALARARPETLLAGLLVLGFLVAALAKSAQLPFAPWIARALEGPTPSSAIFYGALMVHAGVYLLLRLEPLLAQAPGLMVAVAALGLLTAIYGGLSGLVQTDVKSTLMFATTTQVGLMFAEIGLGLFQVAAWHLGLHALWRAWQFLASPAYMHLVDARPAPPAPGWLARRGWLHTAALQRFWLEPLTDALLVRPTQNIARDVRAIDENVVSRLVGLPAETRTSALMESTGDTVVRGHGVAGALLEWTAGHLDHFESRLILQEGGGRLSALLKSAGMVFQAVEALLERPRYLLLLVMATFVVIL
jgi:NADH:ubiquinone oxidoreductase subunit 5 (subunit L)/multisubunit Na+/H+ antiporter MnhA subunit